MPPVRKTKYDINEKVLCFHGEQLYEAKILNKKVVGTRLIYHVHYNNWTSKWDEFVPDNRICKITEQSLKRKSRIDRHDESLVKKRIKSHVVDKDKLERNVADPSRDVTNIDVALAVETAQIYKTKVEIKVKFPDALKPMLIEDWENIVLHCKLVKLPALISVEQVLLEYNEVKSSRPQSQLRKSTCASFLSGLRQYFNISISSKLLYPFEKKQFAKLMSESDNKQPSDVYGCRHLLRFLSKVGEILANTDISREKSVIVVNFLSDFFKYIIQNAYALFTSDDYIRIDRSHRKKRRIKVKMEENISTNQKHIKHQMPSKDGELC